MWLGNEKIHALTTQDTELLIQLEAADGSKGYAIYDEFRVGNEDARYQLSLGIEFSGNLPNTFSDHRDFNFVTQDSDSSENCSTTQGGGWWFTNTNCGNALLNSASMKWNGFPTPDSPVTVAEMKIRRKKGVVLTVFISVCLNQSTVKESILIGSISGLNVSMVVYYLLQKSITFGWSVNGKKHLSSQPGNFRRKRDFFKGIFYIGVIYIHIYNTNTMWFTYRNPKVCFNY